VFAGSVGDPGAVAESLLQRLKTKPIVVTTPDGPLTVTYALAVQLIFGSLYSTSQWQGLSDFFTQLASGKVAAGKLPAGLAELRGRRGEEYASLGNAAQPCVETPKTGRPLAYPAEAAAADRRAPHFGRYRAWIGAPCEFMPVQDNDAVAGPWDLSVKTPVLVFGTRHDPATPYDATRPFADMFPDARMVTLNGWGHTTLLQSACADAMVTSYLVGLKSPVDGAVCQPDRQPFAPGAAAARGPVGAQWQGGLGV
jgi:hypothetical protein